MPTAIVWGLDDPFFPVEAGRWLRDTIPGVVDDVEVPDASLFFAEDRPDPLVAALRRLWATN